MGITVSDESLLTSITSLAKCAVESHVPVFGHPDGIQQQEKFCPYHV